ncbi:MAG: hypothetical protein KDH93_14550 [Rhodoferax sp.]|nr:hypothetical protein [Rhodoferax sp.]
MTHRISAQAELEFPFIGPDTFIGRDVVLKGAEPGDAVQLAEPWQRPAGVTYFTYVRETGIVRVCCRNHTVDAVKVPAGTYGVTIEQP